MNPTTHDRTHVIRRKSDGLLISSIHESKGYRHLQLPSEPDHALRVDDETAYRLCDLDELGQPLQPGGYNSVIHAPEFERVAQLDLPSTP